MAEERDPALLTAELQARVEHARGPYDEAVWRLLLGEAEAGLASLRRGLPGLISSAPASLGTARLAVLVDDQSAPSLAAAAIDDVLAGFVAGDREYHATTLALMAGDTGRAVAQLAQLDAYVASHDALRSGQPASVSDIPRGLLLRDPRMTTAGLAALLAWHLRRARQRSDIFNSSHGVISLEAIVGLVLAHRLGLATPVERTYRAAELPLLVLHVSEWNGRPLPRAQSIRVVSDLVAGPWLRLLGIPIEDAPAPTPHPKGPAKRSTRGPTLSPPEEQSGARRALQARVQGAGSAWQLASWALMLGDVVAARRHLQAAADSARDRWRASAPPSGGLSRLFSKDQALPNQNIVREHFGYALALGDEGGLRESIPVLQGWLRTQEGRGWGVYAHTSGYLDLICDLIGGGDRSNPARSEVEKVSGGLSSTRVAAIALFDRDAALLREGLDEMLAEHAKNLERKSSPPPPICEPAVHLAAAARRLGISVMTNDQFAAWPVPVDGARLPCDLLGRALWTGSI